MLLKKDISDIVIRIIGSSASYTYQEKKQACEILLDYFIKQFQKACYQIVDFDFYQFAMKEHDRLTEAVSCKKHTITNLSEISEKRRILKYIIEFGCEVVMTKTSISEITITENLEKIYERGKMILFSANMFAELIMVNNFFDITLCDDRLLFSRSKQYEYLFEKINAISEQQIEESIIDQNALKDLSIALCEYMEINIVSLFELIKLFCSEKRTGMITKKGLITHLCFQNNIDKYQAEEFLNGLIINSETKMSLKDLVWNPNKFNRFHYCPFIEWKIDGNVLLQFSLFSFDSCMFQVAKNAIPFGHAPKEWLNNKNFKRFVDKKNLEHEKLHIHAIISRIKHLDIFYDKNVKKFRTNGRTIHPNKEFDLIIICKQTKQIIIAECKYLKGRFNAVDQLNDFNEFNNKFIGKLKEKVQYAKNNIFIIERHFKLKYSIDNINFNDFLVKGIFIINTPTFYMHIHPEFQVITISDITKYLIDECTTSNSRS